MGTDSNDLLVEILGILGNMTFKDINFLQYFHKYKLTDFLYKHLVPGYCEDDIVLEVIIVIGTFTNGDEVATLIANSPIIRALCDIFLGLKNITSF